MDMATKIELIELKKMMFDYYLAIIEEINENIKVIKELKYNDNFKGIAFGLVRALALMDMINEAQENHIDKCIENNEYVYHFELDKFKDGE